MSNQISEEAPDKKKDGTEGSPEQSSEKKIRQAVYDIRYRARREELDVRHAFSQYVGNSGLSQQERAAVKDKLFGKDGGGASDQAESLAIESVSNALFKVFESSEDTKYKIRVTDKEKGTSYVRYGDRKKITQLRSNPNISSVEMTGHGDPYEGDKSKKGEKTPNIKKSKGKNAEVKGKDHNIDLKKESYIVTEADKKGKKKKNKEERWQDSDGDGKWYEPGDDIKKEAYTVTAADKKGNTPAYQGYKAGKKNVKTGEPLYKAADHLNKEGYQRDPEQQEKERKTSKQSDPSKAGFTGISGSIATIMKQNAAMKKAAAAKKVKNEEFIADAAAVAPPSNKKITGEKVDNSKLIKVYPQDKSDPQIGNIKSSKETDGPVILEIVRRLREGKEKGLDGKACWKGYKLAGTKKKGGKTVDNCVKVKEDAEYGYDDEGKSLNPKDQKKESKKKEEEDPRSMETKWNLVKNKLRSMGLNMSYKPEGELVEQGIEDILARLEKKRISKGGNPDASPLGKKTGRAMKAQQDKVRKKAGIKTEEVENLDELKNSTLLSYSQKATNQLAFKGDGSKKAQNRATGVKRATGKLVARATDPDGSLGYNKNPKNEEVEYVDENRMAAYTAGAGEGSPASRPTVSKKTADRVSRSSDERAFGNRKRKEGIRLSPTKKYGSGPDKNKVVKRANTTGRGTPTQYRKSHEDPDMGRYQQKVTQGSGSIKGLKKEHHQKDADGNTIPHEQINEVAPLIAAAGKVAVAGAKKAVVGAVKAKAKQVVTQKATQSAGAVEDRVQKPIGAVESYVSESTIVRDILELNRFEKETGTSSGSLNMPKGKPTQKGGTSSPVMRAVRTSIRKETGKPAGQQKKVKGAKPPVAGEYGARKSPAQIVQKRRADKASADAAMSDTRGT